MGPTGKIAFAVVLTTSVLFMLQQLLGLFGLVPAPIALEPRVLGVFFGSLLHVLLHLTALALVFQVVQAEFGGARMQKGVVYGSSVALLWMLGVLAGAETLDLPWWQEALRALADGVGVLFFGLLLGSLLSTADLAYRTPAKGLALLLIGGSLVMMRFWTAGLDGSFLWTLAVAVSVGWAYILLGSNPNRRPPLAQALWFGGLVFGVHWTWLFMYLPLVYAMAPLPILLQAAYDTLAIMIGIWLFEHVRHTI